MLKKLTWIEIFFALFYSDTFIMYKLIYTYYISKNKKNFLKYNFMIFLYSILLYYTCLLTFEYLRVYHNENKWQFKLYNNL